MNFFIELIEYDKIFQTISKQYLCSELKSKMRVTLIDTAAQTYPYTQILSHADKHMCVKMTLGDNVIFSRETWPNEEVIFGGRLHFTQQIEEFRMLDVRSV